MEFPGRPRARDWNRTEGGNSGGGGGGGQKHEGVDRSNQTWEAREEGRG